MKEGFTSMDHPLVAETIQREVDASVEKMRQTKRVVGEGWLSRELYHKLRDQGILCDQGDLLDSVVDVMGKKPLIDPAADEALHIIAGTKYSDAKAKQEEQGTYLSPSAVMSSVYKELRGRFPELPIPFSRVEHVVLEKKDNNK